MAMVDIKDLAAMIGQTYGNWLVIKFIDVEVDAKQGTLKQYVYLCECTYCGSKSKKHRGTLLFAERRTTLTGEKRCRECLTRNGRRSRPSNMDRRLKEIEWLKSLSLESKKVKSDL